MPILSLIPYTGYALAGAAPTPPVTPLVAGANPASQYAASGTTSLVFAFPAASGGTPPYTYAAPVLVKPVGSTSTVTGTAPGNITINNSFDEEAYLLRVVITDADGQEVLNDALGSVAAPAPLTLNSPVTLALNTGVTTGTLVWPSAAGGVPPYAYSAQIINDSTDLYVAYISTQTNETVAFAGMQNNQVLTVLMSVADSVGNTVSAEGFITVAAVAAGTMLPGAFPASQTLNATTLSTIVTFNPVTGVFTPPVTYVASPVNGAGAASNVGVVASLSALIAGGTTLLRLRATDSSGVPQIADAYALVSVNPPADSALVWQLVREVLYTDQTPQSFVLGDTPLTLTDTAGNTFTTVMSNSMANGSYANTGCLFSATEGWKIPFPVATATSCFIRSRMSIPLGLTLGVDDDLRVTITGVAYNVVSGNSFYWQVSNNNTLSEDGLDVEGIRLLRSGANTALFLRAAAGSGAIISQTSTPPCPLAWQAGTTPIQEVLYFPRRLSRGIVSLNAVGSSGGPQGSLGQTGSVVTNTVRPGWAGGQNSVEIQHYVSNGVANGGGAQFSSIQSIRLERRTLP